LGHHYLITINGLFYNFLCPKWQRYGKLRITLKMQLIQMFFWLDSHTIRLILFCLFFFFPLICFSFTSLEFLSSKKLQDTKNVKLWLLGFYFQLKYSSTFKSFFEKIQVISIQSLLLQKYTKNCSKTSQFFALVKNYNNNNNNKIFLKVS